MSLSLSSRHLAALACCAALFGMAGSARAQQNSLFGGSGPSSGSSGFGTASTGASFGVGTSGGMMGSGASGMGAGMGLGMGTGQTGMGLGATGMGATGATGMQGMGQQQRTGLVGQSNQRFVGNAQAGQNQQGMNQNRAGQNRGAGNRRAAGQNPNQANQGQAQGNPAQGRAIRPQLQVAFSATRPTLQKSAGVLSTRFETLSSRAGFEGITVQTEGNNVILRGQVDSASTSRLAAALARMEPGVRSVKNELTVKSGK